MKKIISLVAFIALSMVGLAQNVVYFEVGPYEVSYKGSGDYKFRLRNEVDLYDYFDLKRDTTIQVVEAPTSPVKSAFQLNVSLSIPRYVTEGTSNVWGIDGSWKRQIGRLLFFNAGMSVAMSYGKYGVMFKDFEDWKDGSFKETMFEIGVPLSIELSKLDRKKASMYGSVGIVPAFYTGGTDKAGNNQIGLVVAPRLDIGGYIPVGNQLVRLGGFAQENLNCSAGDYDIFKERIGRFYVGANIGLVF